MKTRFNKYGDSADGRHVSEFENADLTIDELWQKLNAANEAAEDEIEEQCLNEITKRRAQERRDAINQSLRIGGLR
jgi:predicted Holliday junction resolvase-like endonuclease